MLRDFVILITFDLGHGLYTWSRSQPLKVFLKILCLSVLDLLVMMSAIGHHNDALGATAHVPYHVSYVEGTNFTTYLKFLIEILSRHFATFMALRSI